MSQKKCSGKAYKGAWNHSNRDNRETAGQSRNHVYVRGFLLQLSEMRGGGITENITSDQRSLRNSAEASRRERHTKQYDEQKRCSP